MHSLVEGSEAVDNAGGIRAEYSVLRMSGDAVVRNNTAEKRRRGFWLLFHLFFPVRKIANRRQFCRGCLWGLKNDLRMPFADDRLCRDLR